jgi:hypothetical protein
MKQNTTKKTQARKTPNVCRIYARITPSEADKLNALTSAKNTTVSAVLRELIRNT